MLVSLLASAALIAGEPDGVIVTAAETPVALDVAGAPVAPAVQGAAQDAAAHGLTTDEQIDQWLTARSADAATGTAFPQPFDDREPHSEFSVSVGTDGYRDYAAAVSLPVGENGRLDLSWRQVENGVYGYGYGRGWGDPVLDDGGYAFPGYRPGAAAAFEWRAARPGGPPARVGGPVVRPLP